MLFYIVLTLWGGGIQNIKESMSNMRLDINTINTQLFRIEDRLQQLEGNEEY